MKKSAQYITLKPMLPNFVTVLALCSGLTAIRMALLERWEMAIFAIILASLFDFADGRIARILHATSRFGAELDSLSDLVCFGVAPSLLVYLFALSTPSKLGWCMTMFYTVCLALRLARFNTITHEGEKFPRWTKKYFVGIPAPCNAYIVLSPLCLYLATDWDIFQNFFLNAFMLCFVGCLAISRLPAFSAKSIQLNRSDIPLYTVGFLLFAIMLSTHTWLTIGCMGLCYLFSLPFSYRRCQQEFSGTGSSAKSYLQIVK